MSSRASKLLREKSFEPRWSGSPEDVVTLPIEWDRRPPEDDAGEAD